MSSFNNAINRLLLASSVMYLSFINSAIANFTPGKGIYSFSAEIEGSLGTRPDNEAKNKLINYQLELDNEFGITENSSIEVNFYSEKDTFLKTDSDHPHIGWVPNFQYAEMGNKLNFPLSVKWTAAMENLLRFYSSGGPGATYKPMYQLRGFLKHSTPNSFFTQQRIELFYRRKFNAVSDTIRLRVSFVFNIAQKVKFLLQSDNFFNINKHGTTEINSYKFQGKLKTTETIFYAGPTFALKNGNAIYAVVRYDLGGNSTGNKKGIMLGYSQDINFNSKNIPTSPNNFPDINN